MDKLKQDARPSVMYNFVQSWNTFLQNEHEKNDEIPGSLTDLANIAHIRLVVAGSEDLNNCGFIQWRNAFYIAGDISSVKNFLFLCDAFFIYMKEQLAREQRWPVDVYPHVNIALTADDLSFKLHSSSKILPLKVFEAQPPGEGQSIATVLSTGELYVGIVFCQNLITEH